MFAGLGELSALLAFGASRYARRAERRLAMATATKNARSPRQRNQAPGGRKAMEFRVFEDNDGDYHWVIVAASGATLAQSSRYSSFDDAEQAAKAVRDGA